MKDTPSISISCDTSSRDFIKWYLGETVYIILGVLVVVIADSLIFGNPISGSLDFMWVAFLYPTMVLISENISDRSGIATFILLSIFVASINVDISISGSVPFY